MADNKNTLAIVIAAIVFLVLGIFWGSSLTRPVVEPAETPEADEELWFVYTFFGEVTNVKDNLLLLDGEIKDPQGKPIYREAVVTAGTNIVLRELTLDEDGINEEYEYLENQNFQKICKYMESINWSSTVIPRTLFDRDLEFSSIKTPEEKEITLEEIKPGDRVNVSSNENIAANVRFEATTIFVTRY